MRKVLKPVAPGACFVSSVCLIQGCTQAFNTKGRLSRSTITEGAERLCLYMRPCLINNQALKSFGNIDIWTPLLPLLIQTLFVEVG